MCDNCTDFVNLLETFADRVISSNEDVTDEEEEENHHDRDVENLDKFFKPSKVLLKVEVERLCGFIHSWFQRQCICCFREGTNYERFSSITQNLIRLVIKQLYIFKYQNNHVKENEIPPVFLNKNCWVSDSPEECTMKNEDRWTHKQLETLFHLLSKVFLVNYPLYLPFKQPIHGKVGDAGRDGFFGQYCDLTEQDVSAYLLQNVDLFCRLNGIQLIADCFDFQDLPVIIAHALITIVCNLKMWLNVRSIVTLFFPLRAKVLRFMCQMSDKDLRSPAIKLISDYMWSSVKDPIDTPLTFDKDGLDLAFKYFTSSTLTMRLAGIAQINSHITSFNDICNTENMLEAEGVGQNLTTWLTDNNIISHIFGPNLHVEIIKQSHIILNFLAMESKITNDDIDIIWQAAQLKHCSKQVFDLLVPLIKNLEPSPVTHLYHLLYKMEPKDHTEQSLLLASSIIKFIWTNGSTYHNLMDEAQSHAKIMKVKPQITSGSENSALGDAENSDVDSSSDAEEMTEDATPRKKMKLMYSKSRVKSPSKVGHENVKVVCQLEDSNEENKSKEPSKKLSSGNSPAPKENVKSNDSLKRPKTGSQEDIKTSHEEKKHKSMKDELQITKPKVPVMRCGGSKLENSEDEDVDVDDEVDDDDDEEDNLDDDDDDDDEEGDNELTESDDEVHSIHHHHSQRLRHSRQLQHHNHHHHHHALKKPLTEQSLPNLVLSEMMDETMSGEDCSVSSRMSNKSEKNMADFDGEDSVCDDELMQLAAHAQANLTPQQLSHIAFHTRLPISKNLIATSLQDYSAVLPHFNLENVCKPGSTLLWDLVQDDKIGLLAENMAFEAEKILFGLVCYNTDKSIKMKFIEGCLENVQKNRSVVISLRLLPKIFLSFHPGRGSMGMDVNQITLWAFQKHSMMDRVFSNLITYMKDRSHGDFYSHLTHVQVRLQFLSHVFSPSGLPESIRLMVDELECLWQCLAKDPETSDDFFSWLLRQVKCKEQHALDHETLKYLYTKLMPSLAPEEMTMVALTLLQQLCSISRVRESPVKHNSDVLAMEHLWKIALKANNTDVSLSAMQYINNYYMSRQLEQEPEFISQCMENLSAASKELHSSQESTLLCIQRALLLLKTHLETFKRRFAYHLRRWALEGQGISSHVISWELGTIPLHITVHAAGMSDKVTLEMSSTDYVADLRAEVGKWWEAMTMKRCQPSEEMPRNAAVKPFMLPDGQLRMITQGQELLVDYDEKTLAEVGFKDSQIVYVSVGASRMKKKGEGLETPSILPPPRREHIPTLLLLGPEYFETLFKLMHTLSTVPVKPGQQQQHTRAQVLSRRVWDILTLLPTNPTLLEGFQKLGESDDASDKQTQLEALLDPSSPQKLMYSLYIVEALTRPTYTKNLVNQNFNRIIEGPNNNWSEVFIQKNGLKHLFNIFLSGVLQNGSEWHQDCLAHLLKLLCQLGVPFEDRHSLELFDSFGIATLLPNISKSKRRRCNKHEKLVIPCLNQTMLELMNVDVVMPRFCSILMEMSSPRELTHYKTGFWGRAQVVHFAMALLVSWSNSSPVVSHRLLSSKNFSSWLSRLVLEDPDPSVRREISTALFRLCTTNQNIAPTLLSELIKFIEKAERMRPQRHESLQHPQEEGKEPYGPTCRDYFWLLCRLVDILPEEIKDGSSDSAEVELTQLANRVWESIKKREYVERRHSSIEDDGLVGMLSFMCNIMKYDSVFKFSKSGLETLDLIFEYLFELPDANRRYVPKCKSQSARSAAYDLLVELVKCCSDNYKHLHSKVLAQHRPSLYGPYPWDYWPHDDGRAECGFVGLTNLGATCYMASCMQHLYMMPEARNSILKANSNENAKHWQTLKELQRMFAYLMESERKTYNPRSFCKVYTMDHQPLNTAEQKDMAEFFIDLVSKLEEMTPELKELVKNLFGGVISNNVVSLDCSHVSCMLEEFYTVRCQVADMRSLNESLNEVTVKDTLEGDNMYTCSQCGKKVRAEKRACFKKLPKILCFNTMRYTFNMVTMTKEKVNTHFSFPIRLDMSEYVEKHLMPQQYKEDLENEEFIKTHFPSTSTENHKQDDDNYEYELIGVTVHTGTADGGHYYSFIRDRSHTAKRDKWFFFNDAEVKPFDPNQIPAECFGGEMTSKTYDSVTDKFMDLSFEKTNSAYMLFYERVSKEEVKEQAWSSSEGGSREEVSEFVEETNAHVPEVKLSKELEDWIWQDNMQFLQDKNIFEHTYFQFLWQICGFIPQTLENPQEMTEMAAQLTTTFFLETFIHSKEKPTMVQWVELLTKQFNMSQNACEWFLQNMAVDNWWPVQILIRCPNQMVRQMFQRLCIHVIQRLRSIHAPLYLKTDLCDENSDDLTNLDAEKIGCLSCVTMFIKMLLSLLESSAKNYWKNLSEYFTLLNEFSKMGEQESQFLLSINTIYSMANFYLGQKPTDLMEMIAEDEEEDELLAIPSERCKPTSLEKMITLIATLVEKARGPDHTLKLPLPDLHIIAGGKGFLFLIQQIKDNINLHQTRNLIYSLCRWNDNLANQIVTVIFNTIQKLSNNPETCQPFYRILTFLCEMTGSAGLPCFTQLILRRVWDVADISPYAVLDWLSLQVPRNKIISNSVLSEVDSWMERFLLGHMNQRVRSAAAYLLIQLIPCPQFRQGYRINRVLCNPQKDLNMSPDSKKILHQVYQALLNHLKVAKTYVDIPMHGTTKLTAYFSILNYCTISKTEKLLFGPYLNDLWHVFYPKLSEPGIPVNQNKQALLIYWHQVLVDCPENVQSMLQNNSILKNLPFNYILADNDDQEVIMFNRFMLPAYYGILRLMCVQSRTFTRQLAGHQNMSWAFKNISMFPTQYPTTVDELFKLMQLFVKTYPDSTDQELAEVREFRRQTLQLYIQVLDPRSGWGTLIPAVKLLIGTDEDRLFFIFNGGLHMCFQAFQLLHNMYHEATACHVYNEILDLLGIIFEFLKCLRDYRSEKEVQNYLMACKDWSDIIKKLFTLLNSYSCNDMRRIVLDILREMVMLLPNEVISVVVPFLIQYHGVTDDNVSSSVSSNVQMGPYFPHRGHKVPPMVPKNSARPVRPIMQMAVNVNLMDVTKGVDAEYDKAVSSYYLPYHNLVNIVCRLAVEHNCLVEQAIILSSKLGLEGVTLHFTIFPKFWLDLHQSRIRDNNDKDYVGILVRSRLFHDYIEAVLIEERASLMSYIIYNCVATFLPEVSAAVLTEQNVKMLQSAIPTLDADVSNLDNNSAQTFGTIRALNLVFHHVTVPPELQAKLNSLLEKVNSISLIAPKEEEYSSRKKKTFAGNSSAKDEVNVDDDSDSDEIEEEEVSDEEEEINEVAGDDEEDDEDDEDDDQAAAARRRNPVAPPADAGEPKVEESKKSSIKEPRSHDS